MKNCTLRDLADKARARRDPLKSAEVVLAFDLDPASPPVSVFIPGQMAMLQDDPLTEEFSDRTPMKAYATREEAEEGEMIGTRCGSFPCRGLVGSCSRLSSSTTSPRAGWIPTSSHTEQLAPGVRSHGPVKKFVHFL